MFWMYEYCAALYGVINVTIKHAFNLQGGNCNYHGQPTQPSHYLTASDRQKTLQLYLVARHARCEKLPCIVCLTPLEVSWWRRRTRGWKITPMSEFATARPSRGCRTTRNSSATANRWFSPNSWLKESTRTTLAVSGSLRPFSFSPKEIKRRMRNIEV